MKFKREFIAGYPFYRVEGDCPFGEEGHVVGWVEKDCLGDGWWSYAEYPAVGGKNATASLHETRREAAEYLNATEAL